MSSINFFNKERLLVVACALCLVGHAASLQPAYAVETLRKAPAKVTLSPLAKIHEGSARAGMTIARAPQAITFDPLETRPYSKTPFFLAATVSSGLRVTYTSSNAAVATVRGNKVTITGVGTTEITAYQRGNRNYHAAEPVTRALTVNKAKAKVTLSRLARTYDGAPKSVKASTNPKGLVVGIAYDGNASAPVNAGRYTVTATVRDANYEGSAEAGMIIAKAPQKIAFNAPTARTYGDAPFDLVSTSSSGLTTTYASSNPAVSVISGNKVTITGAGSTVITAFQGGDGNYLPAKPMQRILTIAKAEQTIAFDAPTTVTYGVLDFSPKALASSGLPVVYESSDPSVAVVVGNQVHIIRAGASTLIASQPGDDNYLAAKPVTQALTVNKAKAEVSLIGLDQTYDGAQKQAGARTEPEGLSVTLTYDKKATAPAKAGSYAVIGTVRDTNYEGSATATLNIAKAPQTIAFDAPVTVTYGVVDFSPKALASSGLPVFYESSDPSVAVVIGNQVHIVGAGASTLTTSQPGDDNYLAAKPVTQALTVNKAKAEVSLIGLDQTYDGAQKQAGARTKPEGLSVTLTYDNKATAPAKAGSYTVIGTVQDANYEGSATATLNIAKAGQTIAFDALTTRTYGDGTFVLASTVSSGLTASYGSSNPSVAIISGNQVRIAGAGTAEITAYQDGDGNYLAAKPVMQALTVHKAKAEVSLIGLDQTYDATQKQVGARTDPKNLNVVFLYDNNATAPAKAGSYAVVGTVQDANYEGSAFATLTIAKAGQKIAFDAPLTVTYGDADFSPGARASSGLPVFYESSDPSVAIVVENHVHIISAGSSELIASQPGDDNHLAAAPKKRKLAVKRAAQTITFPALEARPYNKVPFSLEAAASSGLTVACESSNDDVATVNGNQVTIRGVGTTTITVFQSGDGNYLAAAPVKQVLTVRKAPANVTLGALKHIYDGKPKSAASETRPARLSVTFTYDGSDKPPVNAGSYSVAATVREDNYEGTATGTMTIAKAAQRITFDPLITMTYGDRPFYLFSEVSSGLIPAYESSGPAVAIVTGSRVTIVGAGTATITASQAGDNNHLEAEPVGRTFIVKKAPPLITLNGLEHRYDGTPKPAASMTSPAGLSVHITYDGNPVAPVKAGQYEVIAAVQNPNYEGSASGTMSIAKASQKIKLPVLGVKTLGTGPFELPAVLPSGLAVDYESSDPTIATVSGNQLTVRAVGTATITAFQEGDGNHLPVEPVMRPLIVLAQKLRIVVFPVKNLSGRPAPLKEIRQSLIEALARRGDVVLDDEAMLQFMTRHRIRYTGGVDILTARAWREETGTEAVLIASVDQYKDSEVPKISLTCRLVSTGEMPRILWMESIGLSGDDSPGLFGSGLIGQIGPLQNKAIKQLMDSLSAFYADRISPPAEKGWVMEVFKPKKSSETPFIDPDRTYKVAIMPFYNSTKNSNAGEILALRFMSQLVKNGAFDVLEPGVVRQKFLDYRIIMNDGIARADAESFFINQKMDLILMGKIIDYQEGNPDMEFEVQVYNRKSKSMAWSSWSYNRGNDAMLVFDWNRVSNVAELASQMVKTIIRDMMTE
ncbi:MAG: MBG domain-containing protein [Nitrospirae bacterium]|nr:MBG domain-containing protein [Nitrospirota bacterium]